MKLLDGKKLSKQKMIEMQDKFAKLKATPHLVVIQVGNNPASNIYIKHKQEACRQIGIKSTKILLPETTNFDELKNTIETLNSDNLVDGILIQFPLPPSLSKRALTFLIDPKKDVDGIHPLNQGINLTGTKVFSPKPCTPKGIMELLKEYKIKLKGKHVVVIGRSNIAGRPMSNMLINANAIVSLLHSHVLTLDKKMLLKNADIIITATGAKDIFTPKMVKHGVVIVDVGIIKENNKIRGDIKYKDFVNKASYITPVPGGVGPMTVAMLIENIINIKMHAQDL